MTNEEKKIPSLITSNTYLFNLLNTRVKDIDDQSERLLKLESWPIKATFNEDFFHYVVLNKIITETKNKKQKHHKIYLAAFSGHARRKMYQVLDFVYHHGFQDDAVVVPHPLWYVEEIMSAFYIDFPGENLLVHIKEYKEDPELIGQIASGLKKFHSLPADKIKLEKHPFDFKHLDPTNVLGSPYNRHRQLSFDIKKEFVKWRQIFEKTQKKYYLSHGDFHPGNIIINQSDNNKIAFIDFSESCLAPIYYDLGSFLAQFNSMTKDYLSPQSRLLLENKFVASYFNGSEVDAESLRQINLYKAWTELKSTVYFMIFQDPTSQAKAQENFLDSQKKLSLIP